MTSADAGAIGSFSILAITCFIANSLFAIAIIRKRHYLPVTAKILASLFVVGIVSSALCTTSYFVHIEEHAHGKVDKQGFAPIQFIVSSTLFSSVAHLFFAALERYVAIAHPLRHSRIFTKNCVWVGLALCWVIPTGLAVTVHFVVLHSTGQASSRKQFALDRFCVCEYVYLSVCALSDLIVFILYVRILVIAREQRRRISDQFTALRRVRIRPTVLLFVTATYSLVLWMVYAAIVFMKCKGFSLSAWLFEFAEYLPLLVATLHPCVYGLSDRNIRRAALSLFRRKWSPQTDDDVLN